MRKHLLPFFAVLCGFSVQAQTLVTVGPAEVSVPEFLWVYNKADGAERSEKAVREYLDLYINFRLKVLDAESLGMHNEQTFIDELSGYRVRLADRYLLEREVSDRLVKEAYDRSLKIINASHILVLCAANATAADTSAAFAKITAIRSKALSGTPFDELAATDSEEPGATSTKGYLGNFSVFQMIYPFETAAYKTPANQISEIVRTRFGYHLIKVHEVKVNPGKVEVEQIVIAASGAENASDTLIARTKAFEIHKRLMAGADFITLANQFSSDKRLLASGNRALELTPGQSDRVLEAAAFALKVPGDISTPVKTQDGWHIIRLVRKMPIPPFDVVKQHLRDRVAADARSVLGQDVFVARLKKQYHFQEDQSIKDNSQALIAKLSSAEKNGNDLLFTYDGERAVLSDFLKFLALEKQEGNAIADLYKKFVQFKLSSLENQHLEEKYPEFRFLLNEYRNGILLFNLSEKKIWNLTSADSSKIQSFYKSRLLSYSWKERADAQVYMAGSAEDLNKVKALLSQNKTDAEILSIMNSSNPLSLSISKGLYERGSHLFVDRAKWKQNSESEINIGNAFVLVRVNNIIPPSVKPFAEIEGFLLADYQQFLESNWLKELKDKYPVKINQAELKKISN
ncbi:MAG TPA: peptidylprolyl isomerase [Daejeonella sp.]|nr:peptidylprolyl isomerase [Daejeonella sp.]